MHIREATAEDWPAIWPFFHTIAAAGETFVYPLDLTFEQGREWWMLDAPNRTVVAVDEDGTVMGSANMHRNRPGPGSHVASGNYMVAPTHQGKGIGRALLEHTVDLARHQGYRAMQFNAVAANNHHALKLYQSVGFEIVGTVPEAFHHPTDGYIGLHVLHLYL
ncbi:GNAT family N-acetyltransferase [Kitasatospora sp. NPDC051170]|uniref:GNAT family N-acetyltransferase n=1 Tax=Kitasatospora sp. NPDC051170 TaxID=3364056 RepID=UPI003790A0FA